jgi:excisionase family DNA binding protein
MLKNYPDILNVKELSQILRIGKNAAYALVNSGAVPSRRVGKKYLIPKKSVLDFLREKGEH